MATGMRRVLIVLARADQAQAWMRARDVWKQVAPDCLGRPMSRPRADAILGALEGAGLVTSRRLEGGTRQYRIAPVGEPVTGTRARMVRRARILLVLVRAR